MTLLLSHTMGEISRKKGEENEAKSYLIDIYRK